jgi:hypothetical protein
MGIAPQLAETRWGNGGPGGGKHWPSPLPRDLAVGPRSWLSIDGRALHYFMFYHVHFGFMIDEGFIECLTSQRLRVQKCLLKEQCSVVQPESQKNDSQATSTQSHHAHLPELMAFIIIQHIHNCRKPDQVVKLHSQGDVEKLIFS